MLVSIYLLCMQAALSLFSVISERALLIKKMCRSSSSSSSSFLPNWPFLPLHILKQPVSLRSAVPNHPPPFCFSPPSPFLSVYFLLLSSSCSNLPVPPLRLRSVKMEQRKLNDQANTLVDLAKVRLHSELLDLNLSHIMFGQVESCDW